MPLRPQQTDLSFISSLQQGEEHAFDILFREYFAALSLFAHRIIHDEQQAEDIVQDCFVKLWERRQKLTDILSIKSYLFTSVRYSCQHFLSRNKNITEEEETIDKSINIESLIIQTETARELYAAIALLPPRMQAVIRLYYLDSKSYQEIGKLLHTNPETVRNQRFKALQLIRKIIIPG